MFKIFLRQKLLILFGIVCTILLTAILKNISMAQDEEEITVRLNIESKKRETILRWNNIEVATDYRVEQSDSPSFKRLSPKSRWINDTTYVFRDLEYNQTYYYRVGARVRGDTIWSVTEQSYSSKPKGFRGLVDIAWNWFFHSFMRRGGVLMWIILLIFLYGLFTGSERAWALRLKSIFPYNDYFFSKYKNDPDHKDLFDAKFRDKRIQPSFIERITSMDRREYKRKECFNMFLEGVQFYWNQVGETGSEEFTEKEKEALRKAKKFCQDFEEYPISRIFNFGLENHRSKKSHVSFEIDRAIESAAANEREKLRKHHSLVWALASLAPMLGLLGTVIGISRSFNELGMHPELTFDEKLPLLATGIYQALNTTVLGLIAAIPLLGIYYYLKDKVDWIYTQWETDTFRIAGKI